MKLNLKKVRVLGHVTDVGLVPSAVGDLGQLSGATAGVKEDEEGDGVQYRLF